jgi:hypothetical protein
MVGQAPIEATLELNDDLASVLSVWAIIFVACPYPVIRDIVLRLGRALSTVVDPEIAPNLWEFIETHERDFMARAIVKLVWLSSMVEPADLPTVSFHQSVRWLFLVLLLRHIYVYVIRLGKISQALRSGWSPSYCSSLDVDINTVGSRRRHESDLDNDRDRIATRKASHSSH